MPYLELKGIRKDFGDIRAVNDVSFDIGEGEMLALLGATGAGKTTIVRCIAGLERPDGGSITLNGASLEGVSPGHRDMAVVFPTYSLYFHMPVRDNIGFSLKVRGTPPDVVKEKVREAARLLGIEPLLDRKLRNISGGERQRVAIGRAIVREPHLFLFDEPFTFLDAKLREQLRVELRLIQQRLGIAALFVTSDPGEVLTVGDRVAVVDRGVLHQIGTAKELYLNPVTRGVGDQFSRPALNALSMTANTNGSTSLRSGPQTIELPKKVDVSGEVVFAFRPEDTTFTSSDDDALSGQVRITENLGSIDVVYCDTELGEIVVNSRPGLASIGDRVSIRIPVERSFIFEPETGRRLDGRSFDPTNP